MDKSLQQQLYGGLSKGGTTRQSSPASSNSGRKSFGGFKRTAPNGNSRLSVSGRSNQIILGIRSDFMIVESYGFQLPVLINEALTFSEANNVSVQCSSNGWAWVVSGRRLLVWQYKETARSGYNNSPPRQLKDLARYNQRRGGNMSQCRELTLPQCDIGHRASLVSVFLNDGQQMASCVAVSPTGDVRYWPSIAHDSSSVDLSGILDGQEFDHLLEMPEHQGYLLVTTTCSLVYLQLQLVNGRHVVHHKTIKQPSGFLGGIGKKFASIIIGMNSGGDKENRFVSITCDPLPDKEAIITVLADRWLQRWKISKNCSSEHLLFEDGEIIRKLREEFQQKFWNIRTESLDIDMHLLDMQIHKGKVYIFAGAVNTSHTPQMCYAVAILNPKPDAMQLHLFIPLKLTQFYNASTEKECLSLRFVISQTHLYIYTEKVIWPVNLSNPTLSEIEAEKIELHLKDDRILGASVCGQIPLFFSRTHGLVSVTPGDFDSTDFINTSASCNSPDAYAMLLGETTVREPSSTNLSGATNDNNLYIYDLDPDAMYDFKDEVSQLKAAFVYRMKRNQAMCNTILNELLRNSSEAQNKVNEPHQLDRIVITIAEDLAEDMPAADPRWEQIWNKYEGSKGNKLTLGSSSSMLILTQLNEKKIALTHFINFLHGTGIWTKLNVLPSSGGTVVKPTCYCISDINEKIVAAAALRTIQHKYPKIIEDAINRVVDSWGEYPEAGLTAQDIFYVHICKFQDIFRALSDVANAKVESQQQVSAVANFIYELNEIVLYVIREVLAFREQKADIFSLPVAKMDSYEFLPWTAMSGNAGLRDTLSHFVEISVRYGVHATSDADIKQKLYQQLLELVDIILDGRKKYLESIGDDEKYTVLLQQFESNRRDLISIFIEDKQFEFAAKLAEKYLDFQSLIIICDQTDNQDRLDGYIKKFEEYDFSQFAINWHLRQNRQGEVFERFKGNQAALSQFMRDHPTLGWIQLIFNGDFERAAKILLQLAQNETEYLQRKKSMLSLAKLSAFAAPDSDLSQQVENINVELNIIDYQEELNENLLLSFGYDVENQKVLKIEEIINLYIAEENETANEFDFRKALELLNYLEEPYDARHKIWCAAILRDNWTDYDTNNAVDYLQNLIFFKIVEICHLYSDIDSFLPQMEDFLTSPDLGNLVENKSFQYLLKLTYEYISDTYKKQVDENMEE